MNRLAARRRAHQSGDDSVLPLINVVFLLLIFFMLAGRLASGDPFEIAPPKSLTDGDPRAQEMLVLLTGDGRIAVNGEVVEREALAGVLKTASAAMVRLKADGGVNAVEVVALMELLRDAGVESLDLLTLPAGQ